MTGLVIVLVVLCLAAAAGGAAAYVLACRMLGDPGREGMLQAAVDGAYYAAHEFMDQPHVAVIVMLERLEGAVTPEDPHDIYLEALDAGGDRPDWREGRGRRWLDANR
jgi:nitrous oxide reductase accessory protein NosL